MANERYDLRDPSVRYCEPPEPHCPATCTHLQEAWRKGYEQGAHATLERRKQAQVDEVALRLLGWAMLVALGWIWGRG